MVDVSYISLFLSFIFVISFVLLAWFLKMSISKEILIASILGSVQLTLVGYIVTWIFSVENIWILLGVFIFMNFIAISVLSYRIKMGIKMFGVIFFAFIITTSSAMAILVGINAIEWTGKFVIPIGGILIGQTMNNMHIFLERLLSDIKNQKHLVEANLVLGASAHQSIMDLAKKALKANSIPMVNMLKTLGLIFLPGVMTGLIMSGINPLIAVKFQLIIIYMITFAYGMASLLLYLSIHKALFTKNCQLRNWKT